MGEAQNVEIRTVWDFSLVSHTDCMCWGEQFYNCFQIYKKICFICLQTPAEKAKVRMQMALKAAGKYLLGLIVVKDAQCNLMCDTFSERYFDKYTL